MTPQHQLDSLLSHRGQVFTNLKPAERFAAAWDAVGFPDSGTVCEYQFHPDRGWKFDFAWPPLKVAVEVHGYGYGHQAIAGLARDCEKAREAMRLGWVVLPFSSRCLGSKDKAVDAVELVCEVMERST